MHVIISLIGIVTGFVVIKGMLASQRLDDWTAVFLATTALTSLTGFASRSRSFCRRDIVGIISLVVLLIAILARYAFGLSGRWRPAYRGDRAGRAMAQCVRAGARSCSTRSRRCTRWRRPSSEPPFLIAQTVVMVLFIIVGIAALRQFRPATA